MPANSTLLSAFPGLREPLARIALATLPTPLRSATLLLAGAPRAVVIKEDNHSATLYGGNKVRKLEYLLARALARERNVIATFGAVGSHHALATTLYAQQLGLRCIAFLSHQTRAPGIAAALNTHIAHGTRLVSFGGNYAERIATLRQHLRGTRAMIIPAGGSSWLGNVAFIDAAFEFADQVSRSGCNMPNRLYVATGTMGTAIGLALGFALRDLPIETHAVRITPTSITDETRMRRLARKTAYMLHRLDRHFPADLAERAKLTLRHDFFAGGYAHTNKDIEHARHIAQHELGLTLESTYTAKAMAALLNDLGKAGGESLRPLFWQTYHAAPLPMTGGAPLDKRALPADFRRYFSREF